MINLREKKFKNKKERNSDASQDLLGRLNKKIQPKEKKKKKKKRNATQREMIQ